MNAQQIQSFRDKPEWKEQQGDLIIRKVPLKNSRGLKAVKLHPGASVVPSTNPHSLQGGSLFKDAESNALFAVFKKAGRFVHNQHGINSVPAGIYFIEPKIEVDFLSDMKRPVQD